MDFRFRTSSDTLIDLVSKSRKRVLFQVTGSIKLVMRNHRLLRDVTLNVGNFGRNNLYLTDVTLPVLHSQKVYDITHYP